MERSEASSSESRMNQGASLKRTLFAQMDSQPKMKGPGDNRKETGRSGTVNTVPMFEARHMVPRQKNNEADGIRPQHGGLTYSSTHYVSGGTHAAMSQLSLNRQSDSYREVFGDAVDADNEHVMKEIDDGHLKLRRKLGDLPAQRALNKRHAQLKEAAIKGGVIRDKLDTVSTLGNGMKYLGPKGVASFMLAQRAWEVSINFKTTPEPGAESVNVGGFTLGTVVMKNLQLALGGSLVVSEALKKGHDWWQPEYFTGLGAKHKAMAVLAEDFRVNSKGAAKTRAGSAVAAALRQAYGEGGRDFLESAMNEVDRSAYDYMRALQRRTRPIPVDQHLAEAGVTSASVELMHARVEEARFINTFTGRMKDEQAVVEYWRPDPVFSGADALLRAKDPRVEDMLPSSRARQDDRAEADLDAPTRWNYSSISSHTLLETLEYLEGKVENLEGEAGETDWQQFKWDLSAAKKGDRDSMFRLAEKCEKGLSDLDIEEGTDAYRIAMQLYAAAAYKGDVEAQYRLGHLQADKRFTGQAGLRNDSAAVEWLTLAAENGHPQAQAELGLMHAAGRTGLDAHEAAINAHIWCEEAVNAGVRSPEVFYTLARLYHDGRVEASTEDESKALMEKWYFKAAEAGHPEAQREWGLRLLNTNTVANEAEAYRYLQMAAQQGDPEALYTVGEMDYAEGTHKEKAANYFKRAADSGFPEAQFRLGMMLRDGEVGSVGGKPDYKEAARRLDQAASQGHIKAQCEWAELVLDKSAFPEGEMPQDAAAVARYEKAAAEGSNIARMALVNLHKAGRAGIKRGPEANQKIVELLTDAAKHKNKKDPTIAYKLAKLYADDTPGLQTGIEGDALAVYWYAQAAAGGLLKAQDKLVRMCHKGRVGLPAGPEADGKAAELLMPIAKQKHPQACFELGQLHEQHRAGLRDEPALAEAVKLYRVAAEKGVASAQYRLGRLYGTTRATPEGANEQGTWDEAKRLLKQATDQDHVYAQFEYGGMLVQEAFVRNVSEKDASKKAANRADADKGRKLMESAADEGGPALQHQLALRYKSSSRRALSDAEKHEFIKSAVTWLTRAAEKGHPESLTELARLHIDGETELSQEQADLEARKCLEKAVGQGNVQSMQLLGWMHETERCGPASEEARYSKAIECYKQAADKGDGYSLFRLGDLTKKGYAGVEQGEEADRRAVEFYKQAADKGNADAMRALGKMHA